MKTLTQDFLADVLLGVQLNRVVLTALHLFLPERLSLIRSLHLPVRSSLTQQLLTILTRRTRVAYKAVADSDALNILKRAFRLRRVMPSQALGQRPLLGGSYLRG
jgi:hypothetical protein